MQAIASSKNGWSCSWRMQTWTWICRFGQWRKCNENRVQNTKQKPISVGWMYLPPTVRQPLMDCSLLCDLSYYIPVLRKRRFIGRTEQLRAGRQAENQQRLTGGCFSRSWWAGKDAGGAGVCLHCQEALFWIFHLLGAGHERSKLWQRHRDSMLHRVEPEEGESERDSSKIPEPAAQQTNDCLLLTTQMIQRFCLRHQTSKKRDGLSFREREWTDSFYDASSRNHSVAGGQWGAFTSRDGSNRSRDLPNRMINSERAALDEGASQRCWTN